MTTITDLFHLPPCCDPIQMTDDQMRAARHRRLSDEIAWHFPCDRRYADQLTDLCERIGARPHFGWRGDCPRRLHNRRHRCSHNTGSDRFAGVIDHPVWLRWVDGTWGLLSQTYNPRDDLQELSALGYAVTDLGDAPYGWGTVALLVTGRDRPWLVEV